MVSSFAKEVGYMIGSEETPTCLRIGRG